MAILKCFFKFRPLVKTNLEVRNYQLIAVSEATHADWLVALKRRHIVNMANTYTSPFTCMLSVHHAVS